jgi:hypothetical protein
MNIAYLIYQAERPKTVAEQRDTDRRAGELAMTMNRLLGRRRARRSALDTAGVPVDILCATNCFSVDTKRSVEGSGVGQPADVCG